MWSRAIPRVVVLVGVAVAFALCAGLVTLFVPKRSLPRFRARLQQRGSALVCRILRIRIQVRGSIPAPGLLLVASNHFGVLDPFVLATTMPVAFVGKAEIARWPVFGAIARIFGVVFVDRARQHAVSRFVRVVRRRMESGVPVLVFPEGTTSGDGRVLPFKTGAFASVVDMPGARVLPVHLLPVRADGIPVTSENWRLVAWANTNESYLANLLRMASHHNVEMEVLFGEPIEAARLDRKTLARKAWKSVVALGGGASMEADTFGQ